ncbi:MAG: hypothetical protein ABL856_10175, partial [Gallionella sp.]
MKKILALLFLLPALCLASSDSTPPVNQAAVNITGGLIRNTTANEQYVDATGTGGEILASYPTADPVLADGYRLDVGMAFTNTIAAPTFAPTLGGVLQTARPITKQVGLTVIQLVAGDIPAVAQLVYDLPNLRWILLNPATVNATNALFGASTGALNLQSIAGSPTLGGIYYGGVVPSGGNYLIAANANLSILNAGVNSQLTVANIAKVTTTATGVALSVPMSFSTAGHGITGSIVATNPSAGTIGEYIAVTVATPGIALTTGVVANITSQLLQAGDYDVSGQCNFLAAATTSMTIEVCGISTTTAALG